MQADLASNVRPGPFASVELERDFGQHLMPQAIPQARLVVGVMTLATVFFTLSDYQLLGNSELFWWLVASRIALAACGLVALAVLRPGVAPGTLRMTAFCYALLVSLFTLGLAPSRPPAAVAYPLTGFSIMMLTYLAFPLPRRLQVWPAVFVSAGIAWWAFGSVTLPMVRTAALTAIVGGNLVGYIVSGQLDTWQRASFLAIRGQADALAEVRALQGILPICSHCKNVRDDSGYWHEVEVYMRQHSEAEFSHAICPNCLRQHYPEHADAVIAETK